MQYSPDKAPLLKYYDRNHRRLIQTGRNATAQFWDDKWQDDQIGVYDKDAVRPFVELTAEYLPAGAKVLEGGCGTAGKVAALLDAGYAVTGIDFAEHTVQRIRRVRPEFEVRVGDVFALPFEADTFDGYWSFGVIEHFWDGYDGLLMEARRVLREEGHLFLTFPSISPLRACKAMLGIYPRWEREVEPQGFYQFLLDPNGVCDALGKNGFEVVHNSRIQANSGAKQELKLVWKLASLLSNVVPDLLVSRIGQGFEAAFASTLGHLSLVAARKKRREGSD